MIPWSPITGPLAFLLIDMLTCVIYVISSSSGMYTISEGSLSVVYLNNRETALKICLIYGNSKPLSSRISRLILGANHMEVRTPECPGFPNHPGRVGYPVLATFGLQYRVTLPPKWPYYTRDERKTYQTDQESHESSWIRHGQTAGKTVSATSALLKTYTCATKVSRDAGWLGARVS